MADNSDNSTTIVIAVAAVLILLIMLLIAWLLYAFYHPQSRSGEWLIAHQRLLGTRSTSAAQLILIPGCQCCSRKESYDTREQFEQHQVPAAINLQLQPMDVPEDTDSHVKRGTPVAWVEV